MKQPGVEVKLMPMFVASYVWMGGAEPSISVDPINGNYQSELARERVIMSDAVFLRLALDLAGVGWRQIRFAFSDSRGRAIEDSTTTVVSEILDAFIRSRDLAGASHTLRKFNVSISELIATSDSRQGVSIFRTGRVRSAEVDASAVGAALRRVFGVAT